jgi:hypothetical protein
MLQIDARAVIEDLDHKPAGVVPRMEDTRPSSGLPAARRVSGASMP